MKRFPSRSAFLHLRLPFSLFLLPIFVFALSQSPIINIVPAVAVFISWHFFIYPASNCYNSYFDKDEGSIALLKHPPKVDQSLFPLSLLVELAGIIIAVFAGWQFTIAVICYGIFSKLYSHPLTRLKKYPIISFLVVFVFQGAFVYWSSYSAISDSNIMIDWNTEYVLAGLVCSCLIGASYPLTQVYQHTEDIKRGDQTLSILLGIKGSFLFSAILFISGAIILFIYWQNLEKSINFLPFIVFSIPIGLVFTGWLIRVFKDNRQANFKNMSQMTFTSSLAMLSYFLWIFFSRA